MRVLEFNCEVPGCDRYISIEMVENPTGDRRRAEEDTQAAFNRQVQAHMSTHRVIGYQTTPVPAGQRRPGPDED